MGAPGLLTKWKLGAASVSLSCHSGSLSSHTHVLLKSGTWGGVPVYHAPEDSSWQTEVAPTTSLMWVNSERMELDSSRKYTVWGSLSALPSISQ